jgi:hypothetical protein
VQLPAVARDIDRVHLTRADFWLELDDTVLSVNEELSLRSDADLHVVGSESEPVLRIALPQGAELLGISPEARQLGALPTSDGVSLVGPVPPGETRVTVRYRVAASEARSGIELRLPRDVDVVNVLVADTGLEIESERLHRRRPFASGTRTYLHREAFHVKAGEAIGIALVPLQRGRTSRTAWAAIAAVAMLAAAAFVMAPLRKPHRETPAAAADETAWSLRRQAVVQDIRDLDHDFETGKIAPEDYEPMRVRMRDEAIELLRREEASGAAPAPETAQIAPEGNTATCSGCGETADPGANYCSNCGTALGGSRQSA